MNILWFKKDLRTTNHEPLSQAIKNGPFIPIYIFEPELFQQHDYSYRHFVFLKDCLDDLQHQLNAVSLKLIINVGNVMSIFNDIHSNTPIQTIFSHEETGNNWTYRRDIAIKKWCKTHSINWSEYQQFGVIRKLKNRDGWSKHWQTFINKTPINNLDKIVPNPISLNSIPLDQLEQYVTKINSLDIQKGGSKQAITLLKSFIENRGKNYHKEMSSPVTAFNSCSRLSAHLTHGSIDLRTIYQTLSKQKTYIKSLSKDNQGSWNGALAAILGRLRWHCHFIQKFEDEPTIEYKNLHPGYDVLDKPLNLELFEAWKAGKTGFPMVDACMRALAKTGWLNFRMRAMVTSFACHHLWLPWQAVSHYLANCFTDYEPGIHYSQIQMQAGTTGINTIRIYNPVKQLLDHDPNCLFVKHWIPELESIEPALIHVIHESNLFAPHYPKPIINEKESRTIARNTLFKIRKKPLFKDLSSNIVQKHGSRKKRKP